MYRFYTELLRQYRTLSNTDKFHHRPKRTCEAVDYLRVVLNDEIKDQIRLMSKSEAGHLYPSALCEEIRHTLGLDGENPELMADCKATIADDAIEWILYVLWFSLKNEKH